MVSSQEVRQVLNESGITQKRCSELVGIPEQYLSEFLNNKRELESDHKIRLADYIEKIKTII